MSAEHPILRTSIEIFTEYFGDKHEAEVNEMVAKLKPIYESDQHNFIVVVYSLVSLMGRERPDFAMEMMMTWLRDRMKVVKLSDLVEEMPEAFGGDVKFDS
jgi:hypothetical protein